VNEITVLVRFFAGAAAAAGTDEEKLSVAEGATVADLLDRLAGRGPALAKVLAASSYLLDAVSARPEDVVSDGTTLDVLPPFAGG
jgi:molybdopterin converting factor small subunit